jgi:hypothetical protein
MGAGTTVDDLLDAVGEQRTAAEPLYVTATRVFRDGSRELDPEQKAALAIVGFESVRTNGAPSVVSVPSVVRRIRAGRPYDPDAIGSSDRAQLMLLGFMALAAEAFRTDGSG